jgi:hypothetical protein
VRAVDIGRHDAGVDFRLDTPALGTEADEGDLVGRFRRDRDEIAGCLWKRQRDGAREQRGDRAGPEARMPARRDRNP